MLLHLRLSSRWATELMNRGDILLLKYRCLDLEAEICRVLLWDVPQELRTVRDPTVKCLFPFH